MSGLALTLFIFAMLPLAFRRPWIGILLWVWAGVMNPHRLTWGFAYTMPFAMMIAIVTLLGILFSRDPKHFPVTPLTVVLLLLFGWMHVSLLFALDIGASLEMWNKVFKIFLMVFVTMYVLHSQQHIKWLLLVVTASIAFYGIKGGLFTLRSGGTFRVWGPAGSYIAENNALAVAVIMTVPLLRYYQLQAKQQWVKILMIIAMMLCAASALGSQSRGALVAITGMLAFLWLKGKNKVITLVLLALAVPVAYNFMPQSWHERMETIANYQEDGSAMGRLDSWEGAINLANSRITGGGFQIYRPHLLGMYTPSGESRSAHSIWFQFLGEHGYPGLILFALFWILVWREGSWLIRNCKDRKGWSWAVDMARMIQVSLVGYFTGGAFLQLGYYDVPYYLAVVLLLTRVLVQKEIESAEGRDWFRRPLSRPSMRPIAPPATLPRPTGTAT